MVPFLYALWLLIRYILVAMVVVLLVCITDDWVVFGVAFLAIGLGLVTSTAEFQKWHALYKRKKLFRLQEKEDKARGRK